MGGSSLPYDGIGYYTIYKVVQKWHNFYALTLPNFNRFSKLFHSQNQEKIRNNIITKDSIMPQVCRYNTL